MTGAVHVWVEDFLAREPRVRGRVLEIGSLDVNGSIREQFADRQRFPEYVGIDQTAGPGVDIQALARSIPFGNRHFSVIVALEMMEHDPTFWLTLAECWRLLKPGGWLLITTRAFGFPRHDYPNDYWRFTTDGMMAALRATGFDYADSVQDKDDLGVFAIGRRTDGIPLRTALATMAKPPGPRLLALAEVEMLRARMATLVPLGITAMADAFARVVQDRALLIDILDSAVTELTIEDGDKPWVARAREALWEYRREP